MKQSTKDNLIYLGVGLTIAAGFTFYIFYSERMIGSIQPIPGPILWGIFSTPGIVALIFEQFWEHRRQRALWVISIIAALVNVSAMFVAYRVRWNPPVMVWSSMTVLWAIVAFSVAKKFVVRSRGG